MVSITMGLIVLAALVAILANNSRARAEIDRSNQQTENGRYALQVLGDDLHNAGYFAEFNPGNFASLDSQLTPLLAVPNPCAWDTASLNADLEMPVQGYDNVTAATAPACLADVRAGTDVVVVRRASTCAVGDAGCDALVNGDP
jgi:type IV pilus assembly protein PilW